ncbi:ABC transporter ATP-binding protein [Smaragdicoccus niigatensis]|uniref:ABC transporter ATP-binding protein n=3 Tax=Smaragdicoccus niigatensis TaxID=359359 RepID=UPI0003686C52|nr:ABC transporter ATP-binding protein [Smaragdicoccus niigatensis]
MSALDVVGVRKAFGAVAALGGVDLSVAEGTTTAILGSSGCGKTTLLRVIAGFEAPDSGTVSIAGQIVAREGFVLPANKRSVGYVAQDGALFPHLTVGKNIAYGLRTDRKSTRARVDELLEMVALDPSYAKRRPHELSGGQQQRVALARALARKPALMLLDEPFSALDSGLRVATRKAVAQTLQAAGVTAVLVTHDTEEAISFADQIAVMRCGQFTQSGTPEAIYRTPRDEFTARFLGDCVVLEARVEGGIAETVLGQVPVKGALDGGQRSVMLRPEQLVLVKDHDGAGRVVGMEFLGGELVVSVRVGDLLLELRRPSTIEISVGDSVRIDIVAAAVSLG